MPVVKTEGIFTEEVLGEFRWVSVDSEPNATASDPAPQPTARGWRAIWTTWGWGFSNGAGAVQFVDPGGSLTGEERAEGLGARAAAAATTAVDAERACPYRPPAAGHSVAAMEDEEEQDGVV